MISSEPITSVYWGPVYMIRDTAPENVYAGVAFFAFLAVGFGYCITPPLKRWKLVAAGLILVAWVFLGIIGRAIDA
jgi:hypothetical protein